MTAQKMKEHGYGQFEFSNGYFQSHANPENPSSDIGKYRVKFHYNKCGQTSVLAQQVKDDDGNWTFRKWNPYKINVPYGQGTDAEADSTLGPLLFCYICAIVNCCMNSMFEEVVDVFVDGIKTPEDYFKEQRESLEFASSVLRPTGIVLTILGLYFLFAPVIALLHFIPLVGALLGSFAALAALIFALVVGSTVSCFTIAVAWVFFRPLIGIPLLCLTAGGIYLAFFFDPSGGMVPSA